MYEGGETERWTFDEYPRQKSNPLGFIFFGLSLIGLGLVVLGIYEGLALTTGLFAPITWEVDRATNQHWYVVTLCIALICFGSGALCGHFWHRETPPWYKMIAPALKYGFSPGRRSGGRADD